MSEPTTAAGRALFTDQDPMDMWESDGVTPADIVRVEADARAAALADVRREVEALPWHNHTPDADALARLAPKAILAILDRLAQVPDAPR